MTREQAIAIRTRQVKGEPVPAILLQEAILVIKDTGCKKGRPEKFRLGKLTPAEKDRADGVLLFNLGKAIGRLGSVQ